MYTSEKDCGGEKLDYLTFHLLFTVPVFAALGAVYLRKRLYVDDHSPLGAIVVAVIAFVYTTPWDSYMIRQEVWWYGEGRVAARFWEVPLGEYLFFLIQPLITGLWLYLVLTRLATRDARRMEAEVHPRRRWCGHNVRGMVGGHRASGRSTSV